MRIACTVLLTVLDLYKELININLVKEQGRELLQFYTNPNNLCIHLNPVAFAITIHCLPSPRKYHSITISLAVDRYLGLEEVWHLEKPLENSVVGGGSK